MRSLFVAAGILLAVQAYGGEWFPVRVESTTYPLIATQARIAGAVRLRMVIDTAGKIAQIDVISGNGILAKAAQDNLKLWKFIAVPTDRRETPKTIDFTYEFRLDGETESKPKSIFRYEHPYRVIVTSEAPRWTPDTTAGAR
jgi:TonB family protein